VSLLTGRVAVVTGASRGIGRAVAEGLAVAGAIVVGAARSLAASRTPARLDVPCDVTNAAEVDALAAATLAAFGVPDLVISNAGDFFLEAFEATTSQQFAAQLAVNLQGPFLVARAFLPAMRTRASGRLITIGSVADHRAFPGNAAYGAAKSGLRGLHQVLREEYRDSGVLCTMISPGPTDTAGWDAYDPDHRPGFMPRHRMLRPEDVAEAVLWVASRPERVDVDWVRLGPA
jgi:NAD(P)-dependent dehydrogenase (short-subunit alcohol dehydrogenase family)